jgi:sugar-specific transcriptional regulator TrmB
MEEIIKKLATEFHLKNQQLLILEVLFNTDLSAQEISKKTRIPLGRIYDFLNSLISFGLIEKTTKKPSLYSMKNPNEKITSFLKYKFDMLVEKENRILNLIQKKQNLDNLEIIHSGDEFTFKQLQLLSECKEIRTVVRHGSIPFPIYPSNSHDFLKVRDIIVKNRPTLAHTTQEMSFMIYKAHKDAYEQGKFFSAIIEKSALDMNLRTIREKFGHIFLHQMIEDIKQRIKKYSMKICIIDEYVPMQIFITEKKVMLSIIHLGMTNGVVIQSDDVVSLYTDFYEDMLSRSKPIEDYL